MDSTYFSIGYCLRIESGSSCVFLKREKVPTEITSLLDSIIYTGLTGSSVLTKNELLSSNTSSIFLSSFFEVIGFLNSGICICLGGLVSSVDEGYVLFELLELGTSWSCYFRT